MKRRPPSGDTLDRGSQPVLTSLGSTPGVERPQAGSASEARANVGVSLQAPGGAGPGEWIHSAQREGNRVSNAGSRNRLG